MTPRVGDRLGSYEVVAPLGAGGMGEVYQARDTPARTRRRAEGPPRVFARDPDRLARFEREARALASLNHPNIAQIYGVEESGAAGAGHGTGARARRSTSRWRTREPMPAPDV